MDEYVIINKSNLLKRIDELKKAQRENHFTEAIWAFAKQEVQKILSQSTPLIPVLEDAFDEGQNRMQHEIIEKLGLRYQNEQVSQTTILNMEVHSEDYISKLKLDI